MLYDIQCNSEKINSLTDMIESLKEDLKMEYQKVFDNDENTQEAIQDLYNYGLYRYTRKGLVKSLKVDMSDFDDLATESFDNYMATKGIEVDSLLGYLNMQVDNYLLCVEDDRRSSFIIKQNTREEIVDVYNKTLSEEEKKEVFKSIKDARQFEGLVVSCNEVGFIKLLDL
jgi:hypothetical protein